MPRVSALLFRMREKHQELLALSRTGLDGTISLTGHLEQGLFYFSIYQLGTVCGGLYPGVTCIVTSRVLGTAACDAYVYGDLL